VHLFGKNNFNVIKMHRTTTKKCRFLSLSDPYHWSLRVCYPLTCHFAKCAAYTRYVAEVYMFVVMKSSHSSFAMGKPLPRRVSM